MILIIIIVYFINQIFIIQVINQFYEELRTLKNQININQKLFLEIHL